MAKRRFKSEKNARGFADKVKGEFKDLRGIPGAISEFVVKYKGGSSGRKKKSLDFDDSSNWSPEDDRDFGYPNEYWK